MKTWCITCLGLIGLLLVQPGCKKLVEVEVPVTSTTDAVAFSDDANAAATLTGIYTNISQLNITSGGLTSLSLFAGLSADELTLHDLSNTLYLYYYRNELTDQTQSSYDYWSRIYPVIYYANAALEGLNSATKVTPAVKKQLTGEAKFIRALCYFYLVNLYGDVPLALGTNYQTNASLARSPKLNVWQQIIKDLKEAQQLLNDKYVQADAITPYSPGSEERVRPNKWAATALLSRTYLYTGEWANAEAESSSLIANIAVYDTVALSNVFKKNNKEVIWQLQPVATGRNTWDAILFVLPATGPNTGTNQIYLNNQIVNSFETGDKRKTNWTANVTASVSGVPTVFHYPYKYKVAAVNTPVTEYLMVLRLAEQYLIRAEARARQGNLSGAAADLNVIRKRAGLPDKAVTTQSDLITAIQQERKVELFTEWGHRWLDLKRTATVDAVMSVVTAQKGGTWQSSDQLYPIILRELQRNPLLVQNPGY